MRSEWVCKEDIEHVLAALTPINRLVCEVALCSGLRIGDVLRLRTEQIRKEWISVQEQKTGKRRRFKLPRRLRDDCLKQAGSVYVFSNRLDGRKHRSRQAVYKDLTRAARSFRVGVNLTPHSLRKAYAVDVMRKTGDIGEVQRRLNHGDSSVTLIYALADRLGRSRPMKKDRKS